jgi:hypothetical protein
MTPEEEIERLLAELKSKLDPPTDPPALVTAPKRPKPAPKSDSVKLPLPALCELPDLLGLPIKSKKPISTHP